MASSPRRKVSIETCSYSSFSASHAAPSSSRNTTGPSALTTARRRQCKASPTRAHAGSPYRGRSTVSPRCRAPAGPACRPSTRAVALRQRAARRTSPAARGPAARVQAGVARLGGAGHLSHDAPGLAGVRPRSQRACAARCGWTGRGFAATPVRTGQCGDASSKR